MLTLAIYLDSKKKRDSSPSTSGNSKMYQDANDSSFICLFFNKGTCIRASCHCKHAYDSCGSKDHRARICKKGIVATNHKWRFGVGGFNKVVLDNLDLNANLNYFVCHFPCLPAPAGPNTAILFKLVNASKPKLAPSPSPLITSAWSKLLLN